MLDIKSICAGLQLAEDGIWYGKRIENISFPTDGYDSCLSIEENSFWFKHRNNCITSIVKSYPPEEYSTIFDIGGGNGYVSLGLVNAGFSVALLEPGKAGASNAKKRGISSVICASLNAAQFKQGSLSAVGLFDVIEHIHDDLDFLRSIINLMKRDSRLYVTVPSYSFLWSEEDVSAGHFRRYNLDTINNSLCLAGFNIEFSSYFFRFLPIPIFLLRTVPYKLGRSKEQKNTNNISRDHAVKGGVLTDILDSILQSEINLLDDKKTMSFGGSCLVVAKKP